MHEKDTLLIENGWYDYHQQARLAGVDEVGRGPLAGKVVAAAVILDPDKPIEGLNDSKKLTEKKRELLYSEIRHKAKSFAIAWATPEEIDQFNILQASLLAMSRAVHLLEFEPEFALVDGNRCPIDLPCQSAAVIGGDAKVEAIAAASILAKVYRDQEMIELDQKYPGYGLAKHKGYPTKAHMEALNKLGATPIHRRSFAPVAKLLEEA